MAIATVTLKVSPLELQIIDEALKMYAFANRRLHREDCAHPLEGYQHSASVGEGDPRRCAGLATLIRQNIGLR